MNTTPRSDAAALAHLGHNGEAVVPIRAMRELEVELSKVRAELAAEKADKAAIIQFCETELNWEYFRAEYQIEGTGASAGNARKLREFLDRRQVNTSGRNES